MKAQRRGSDLRVMIRMALCQLGRDPNEINTSRMSVLVMEHTHRELCRQWKERYRPDHLKQEGK